MIINPYNVNSNLKENKKEENVEQVIEDSIKYLVTNHNKLLEEKSEVQISKMLKKRILDDNLRLDNKQIEFVIKEVISRIFGYGVLQKYIDDKYTTDIRAVAYNDIYIKQYGIFANMILDQNIIQKI